MIIQHFNPFHSHHVLTSDLVLVKILECVNLKTIDQKISILARVMFIQKFYPLMRRYLMEWTDISHFRTLPSTDTNDPPILGYFFKDFLRVSKEYHTKD